MSDTNWQEVIGWNADVVEDLRHAGFSYIRQGKYDIALAFYAALVVLDRGTVYDFQTLGALYLELSQYEKAITALNKALELDPTHSATRLNLAKAQILHGEVDEGLKLAKTLQRDKNRHISSVAKALALAYG